jgi:hypothetical protein
MNTIRHNSIKNISYQPQDRLFAMGDYLEEMREHYVRACELKEWVLAFDLLREMIRLQYPTTTLD